MKRPILFCFVGTFWFIFLNPFQVMSNDNKIPYQQLTIDNFKGAPNPTSPHNANTHSVINISGSFRTTLRIDGKYESKLTKIKYESYVIEEKSWWKDKTKIGDLLRHEQGHFDIKEILARELCANKRNIAGQLKGEGDNPNEAEADLKQQLARHAKKVNQEGGKRSKIYDNETDHSRNKIKQKEWDRKLNEALLVPCMESLVVSAEDINAYLRESAIKGNVVEVQKWIAKGADVNWTEARYNNTTALMTAASEGHTNVVKALLQGGADVNEKEARHEWTSLILAALGGHTDTVIALLGAGADVNAKDDRGWTALLRAADRGHTDTVKALLQGGADVTTIDKRCRTALMIWGVKRHDEIVKLLKQAGAKEQQTSERGRECSQ
jgi:hypothetical protein